MFRWIAIAGVITLAAGCQQQQQTLAESKAEALKRWNHTRAQMLYGVSVEHLKVGELDKARSQVQEALALDPEYKEARLVFARVLIEQGEYAAAATELRKLQAGSPGNWEYVYLTGVTEERTGKFPDALASYEQAHMLDSSNLAPVMAVTEMLIVLGRVSDAQNMVESYMPQAGSEAGMYELAGRIAMMQKRYAKAVGHFHQACDTEPKNCRFRESLATAQFAAKQYTDCITTLKDLQNVKGRTMRLSLQLTLGDCYMAVDQAFQAQRVYQAAADANPDSAPAWCRLAKAMLALDELAAADTYARHALSVDAASVEASMVLGYSLIRQGDAAGAVKVLTDVQRKNPTDGTLLCVLGRAHAMNGNKAEAVRCYNAALKMDSRNDLARELLSAAEAKSISMAN